MFAELRAKWKCRAPRPKISEFQVSYSRALNHIGGPSECRKDPMHLNRSQAREAGLGFRTTGRPESGEDMWLVQSFTPYYTCLPKASDLGLMPQIGLYPKYQPRQCKKAQFLFLQGRSTWPQITANTTRASRVDWVISISNKEWRPPIFYSFLIQKPEYRTYLCVFTHSHIKVCVLPGGKDSFWVVYNSDFSNWCSEVRNGGSTDGGLRVKTRCHFPPTRLAKLKNLTALRIGETGIHIRLEGGSQTGEQLDSF